MINNSIWTSSGPGLQHGSVRFPLPHLRDMLGWVNNSDTEYMSTADFYAATHPHIFSGRRWISVFLNLQRRRYRSRKNPGNVINSPIWFPRTCELLTLSNRTDYYLWSRWNHLDSYEQLEAVRSCLLAVEEQRHRSFVVCLFSEAMSQKSLSSSPVARLCPCNYRTSHNNSWLENIKASDIIADVNMLTSVDKPDEQINNCPQIH